MAATPGPIHHDSKESQTGAPSCHPDFLYALQDTAACAAFIKESRMKFANASKLDRKSGVRWGERGAPGACYDNDAC